uniref:ARAD1B22814p n=1 Tax=Blastobotrys adeninivorans TaxID=409370 RepID=A0A060TCD0_BLAAD
MHFKRSYSDSGKERFQVDESPAQPTQPGDEVRESAGDGTTAEQQILHGAALWLCSLSLLLCMFLVSLDQTIVATLLATVGDKFNDFGKISWISAGFLLPTAVLLPSWGKISLIFGRRYTMVSAVILFEAGSLMCALANSMDVLIGGRVLAGVGGGGIQIMVLVIMTEIVKIEKRGIAQGVIGAAFGIASIVGPLVGGAFTSHVSWRWCFYINLPLGGVALLFFLLFFHPPMPKGNIKQKLLMIDYIGTVLLSGGLVLVLLALSLGSTNEPWDSAIVISFFVVGGVILIVFCAYNFMWSKNPIIPWRVVKVFTVLTPSLAMFFIFGAFMAGVLYLATYFQVVRHADAMQSGIDLLPMIISVVILAITGGILITVTKYTKPVAIVGSAISCIGFGVLTLLDEDSSAGERIGLLILPGVGIGCMFQSSVLSAQTAAPKDEGGVILATTFVGFTRSVGGAIGAAIGQTIQSVVFTTRLAKLNLPLPPESYLASPELIEQLPVEVEAEVINAFVAGYQRVMYFCLAFALCCFISTLFFTNKLIPVTPHKQKQKPFDEEKAVEPDRQDD